MTQKPKVYNKRHKDVPKEAVYVGRPTKWGNPFTHLKSSLAQFQTSTRQEAVDAYREWIKTSGLDPKELAGKDLVCWCAPAACHADILLELANDPES